MAELTSEKIKQVQEKREWIINRLHKKYPDGSYLMKLFSLSVNWTIPMTKMQSMYTPGTGRSDIFRRELPRHLLPSWTRENRN